MVTNKIFELEKNKIEHLCISEELSDTEKGEIIENFMTLFELTQKEVAGLLGKRSQLINRWVISYRREDKLSDEIKQLVKEVSDRTKLLLMRIEEPNLERKQKFFLENKKGLSTSQQETLVSILNGKSTIQKWEKQERERCEKIIKIINKIKKELLHLDE